MNRKFINKSNLLLFVLLISSTVQAKSIYLEWAAIVSGAGDAIVTSSIALDEDENIFAVGSFKDSIEVSTTMNGNVKLISQGKTDMFIAKINPTGELVWIKQIGGKENMGSTGTSIDFYHDPFFSIALDKNRNIYISGHYRDTVDFDPGSVQQLRGTPNVNTPNSFILSLNKDGDFKWVRTLYGGNNIATEIAVDREEGTLYITGHFTDAVDFNNRTGRDIISPTRVGRGSQDIFIAKYDTSANFIWAKPIGGGSRPSVNEGVGIHVDKDGYVYTTGLFRDSVYFDADIPSAYVLSWRVGTNTTMNSNVFVLKLDRDGKYVWSQGMGGLPGSGNSRGAAITTDSKGNVYTTGYFQGEASFDPQNKTPIPSIFGNGITFFLSKLDSTGRYVWQKSFERPPGKNSVDNGFSVAIDIEDNIYAAGYFASSIYLDPDRSNNSRELFESENGTSSLIIKLNSEGNYIWGKTFNTPTGSNRALKALVTLENLYVCGYFASTTDFSPSGIPNNYIVSALNSYDGFVVKMSCPVERDTIAAESCEPQYELNDVVYNESGLYTQIYKNQLECDSIIYLDLMIFPFVKPQITIDNFILSTTSTYKYYQWIKDEQPIPNATDSKYEIDGNGSYQVRVTSEDGCTDTSDVYRVNNYTGIKNTSKWAKNIKVYPNPSDNIVFIQSPVEVNIQIMDLAGRVIKEHANATFVSMKELMEGVYLLNITDEKGGFVKTVKLIKAH